MENIQRHSECDNFQKPECLHYDDDLMKEVYLINEGDALSSGDLPDRIDNELCKYCDEFIPKS